MLLMSIQLPIHFDMYIDFYNIGYVSLHISKNNYSYKASIIDLCMKRHTKQFKGDILVVYGLTCTRNSNSLVKAQLVHTDLTNRNEKMTIYVTMPNHHIDHFKSYFSHGSSVCINRFILKENRSLKQVTWIPLYILP